MIKVALFDVDGVVLKKHEYFSDYLAREYKIPNKKIVPFFKNEFSLCSIGKADLKVEVSKYFESWGWEKSVDDLLELWFQFEGEIDQLVLSEVDKLRKKGIKCYLATNQEKYRLAYLRNDLQLDKHFDGVFASCELGHKKSEQNFYSLILEKLENIQPNELIFWESDEEAVQIAESVGIVARQFRGYNIFKKELSEL